MTDRVAELLVLLIGPCRTAPVGVSPSSQNCARRNEGRGKREQERKGSRITVHLTFFGDAAPVATNPILDPDGSYAAMGQSGKVRFLAGTSGGPATRSITVPTGTALFFPIVNSFWVNVPELGDDPWSADQEAFARSVIAADVDAAQNLVLEIDGKSYAVKPEYRVPSTVGICDLPADNLFTFFNFPLPAGPHECVVDGYWALLPPLSAGEHTIRLAGGFASSGFAVDVTFNVTLRPRQKLAKGGDDALQVAGLRRQQERRQGLGLDRGLVAVDTNPSPPRLPCC